MTDSREQNSRRLFSTKAEYGVMVMTELARHYGKGPVSLTDIAAHLDLDKDGANKLPYLEQLIMPLRRAGLVESRRGAHGGYELSRPPSDIRMDVVIRALEGPITAMACASDIETEAGCGHVDVCSAPVLWTRVRIAIVDALNSTRLSDLVLERNLPLADLAPDLPDIERTIVHSIVLNPQTV